MVQTLMVLFEEYRVKSGLSKNRLADLAGISASYYSKLSTNKKQGPTFEIVVKLKSILDVPTEEVINVMGWQGTKGANK